MSDPDLGRAVTSGVHGAAAEELRRYGNRPPTYDTGPSATWVLLTKVKGRMRKPAAVAREVALALIVLPLVSVGFVLVAALFGPVGPMMPSEGTSRFGFIVGSLPAIGALAVPPLVAGLLAGRFLRRRWRWVLYAWAMALAVAVLLVAADPQVRSPIDWAS